MTQTIYANADEKHAKPYELQQGLNVFTGTRCGWYHERNEDRILYNQNNGFFGLADGVGGGQLGDVAAETLLEFLCSQHDSLPSPELIWQDLQASDIHVSTILSAQNARGAATVVLAWLDKDGRGYFSSVGDARIYLLDIFHDDNTVVMKQITTDQTYENLGVPVPDNRHPDDPIRMVGVGAVGDPPVLEVVLSHNQALLLCSDGIHKFLTTEQMQDICARYLINPSADLPMESICNALVQEAVGHDSHDDCTALLVVKHCPDEALSEAETPISQDMPIRTTDERQQTPKEPPPKPQTDTLDNKKKVSQKELYEWVVFIILVIIWILLILYPIDILRFIPD